MVTVNTPGAGTPKIVNEPISLEFGVAGSSTVTEVVEKELSGPVTVIGTPPMAIPRESRTRPLIDPVLGASTTLRSDICCPDESETVMFLSA